MNLSETMKRIEELNAHVRNINAETQKSIGRKEQLISQRNTAIEKYKADYGVSLTPETLGAETDKVLAEKAKEVAKLEETLALISNGQYEEAHKSMVEVKVNIHETVEPVAKPVLTKATDIVAEDEGVVRKDDSIIAPPPVFTKPTVVGGVGSVSAPTSGPKKISSFDELLNGSNFTK